MVLLSVCKLTEGSKKKCAEWKLYLGVLAPYYNKDDGYFLLYHD